jgi:regulator of cell morphogenesis and NO signaling
MTTTPLAAALEREHREIDDGIERFLAGLEPGDGSTEPLTRAMHALRRHIFLEEEFLFPPLRDAGLFAPIFVMLREHGEIWETLDELDAALRDDPAGAATSLRCRGLLAQLEAHNFKEEPVIYPQADIALAPDVADGLRAFLQAGRLPEGWVCARASGAGAERPAAGAG